MTEKTYKISKYPIFLRVIQLINYVAVIGSIVFSATYFFASESLLIEANDGTLPLNRYSVAAAYLTVAVMAAYVLYKIRTRNRHSAEIYVIANVAGFALFEIINYFSDYSPHLIEYILIYIGEAAIMAYLLLSVSVKKYLSKK